MKALMSVSDFLLADKIVGLSLRIKFSLYSLVNIKAWGFDPIKPKHEHFPRATVL